MSRSAARSAARTARAARAASAARTALAEAVLRRPWALVLVLDLVLLALAGGVLAAVDVPAPEPGTGVVVGPAPVTPTQPVPHWPRRSGFPTPADTGPAGRLQASGPITADQPGAVIENLDVADEINVVAPDVTLRNIRLHGGSATWLLVVRNDTGTTTLDHVSVEAEPGAAVEHGIFQVGNGRLTVRDSRILGTQDGCACASGSITDSYVRLGRSQHGRTTTEYSPAAAPACSSGTTRSSTRTGRPRRSRCSRSSGRRST